jgi:hypothetical protein
MNDSFDSDKEAVQGFTDKNKMPPTPDFSEKMVQPKRANPFLLDDFKGVWAHRVGKP